MTTDRDLDEILAEIGREHRAMDAPDKLERMLRAAASTRKYASSTPRLRATWAWAAVVILLAAVATAGVIWQMGKSHQTQSQQAQSAPVPQLRPEPIHPSPQVTVRQSVRSKSVRRKAGADRASLPDSQRQQATWNSLDEFVALPVSEGLPPASELSVVRVKLRGSDLQQYGLQTPADSVAQAMLAEFVVGEDGLPRAIRIIR